MFDCIDLKGLSKSDRYGYAAKLPFFKGRKSVEFKPGLNILFGPNGCGKSTVLDILAQTMCAAQGGVSTVTETALRDTVDAPAGKPVRDRIGLAVVHDGQPVLHLDPRKAVGLVGGSFDDDFSMLGAVDAMRRSTVSHGQLSFSRGTRVLDVLAGRAEFPAQIDSKVHRGGVNSLWQQKLDHVQARMAPRRERGQPSVLLDEPEAGYSLLWQAQLWGLLLRPAVAERFQVIVATHSLFALDLPGAHYIEFDPEYLERARSAMRDAAGGTLMPRGDAPDLPPEAILGLARVTDCVNVTVDGDRAAAIERLTRFSAAAHALYGASPRPAGDSAVTVEGRQVVQQYDGQAWRDLAPAAIDAAQHLALCRAASPRARFRLVERQTLVAERVVELPEG